MFDGYVQRLLGSANRAERESLYFGYTLHHEYPVLVPTELLFEHAHILGSPGTGKTALGLAPLILQLMRRNDGPVVVLDLKGDMSLFNTVRLEAEELGRTFKWFTNKPYRSTYVFNPWRQSYLERLTLPEILGMMMLSLNMHHGDDYGRSFFSMKARTLLQDALKDALDLETDGRTGSRQAYGPESFVELERLLRDLCRSNDEYRQSEHLLHVLQSLLDLPQLNMTPGPQGNNQAANHAIHMPEVVREKQVVYFWLQSLMDVTTVSEIARLALYSVLTAAINYRDETGQKPRVYFITDEAQNLVAQNIANVLAQASEYQVACVLAHQTLSQLNPPGGVDLRELVLSCTSIKQFWSARDPNLKDYISKISGEVGYYSASWDQFKHRIQRGEVGRQYAASHPNEPMYIQVSEQVGPRLTSQDIEDYSRQPNTSILAIERNAGFSCFQGAFPVHMDWIMSQDEHRYLNLELGWPEGSKETIQTEGVWPKAAPSDPSASSCSAVDEGLSGSPRESAHAGTKLDEFAKQFEQRRRRR
jgi:hypothetical protein